MMNYRAAVLVVVAGLCLSGAARAVPSVTNAWEHTLALGVTATSGNTDTKLYSVSWLSEFQFLSGDLVRLSADAQHGENDGTKNADNAKGDQNFKHLISDRAYLVGDVAELYDSVADISYRITPSLGIGYFFVKNDQTSLSFDVGPGYQWEKIGGVEDDYAILRVAERFEQKLSATAKAWQSAEYTPKVEDTDVYTVNVEVGVEAAMTSRINLRIVYKEQYINIPAADRERNDSQVIGGLSVKI